MFWFSWRFHFPVHEKNMCYQLSPTKTESFMPCCRPANSSSPLKPSPRPGTADTKGLWKSCCLGLTWKILSPGKVLPTPSSDRGFEALKHEGVPEEPAQGFLGDRCFPRPCLASAGNTVAARLCASGIPCFPLENDLGREERCVALPCYRIVFILSTAGCIRGGAAYWSEVF